MPEPTVDEPNVKEGVQPQGAVATAEKPKTDSLPEHYTEEDKQFIRELRKEAAEKRVKAKTVEDELNTLKAEIAKQEENKLKEQGRLQELLEKKESELERLTSIEEENNGYKQYFEEQLEEALKDLTEVQKGILEDSNMDVQKKLKWAREMNKEGSGQVLPSPDSVRPGGKAPSEKINMADYEGPEGIKRLVALKYSNPTLFQTICAIKSKT
jgi:DNA repair exonuclease SbcCD ATPase subunit